MQILDTLLFMFFFTYLSLQGVDMKMSTSSVMTTSDVTGKDGVTFTDRIVNITDQGE